MKHIKSTKRTKYTKHMSHKHKKSAHLSRKQKRRQSRKNRRRTVKRHSQRRFLRGGGYETPTVRVVSNVPVTEDAVMVTPQQGVGTVDQIVARLERGETNYN